MPRGHFDRSERKAETRTRLLRAAAEVYASRGFGGATLDDVAARAGLTKGAVYGHFGSKENLLLALVEEYMAGQIEAQLALFDRERSGWERPLAGSQDWMMRLKQRPERFQLFVESWVNAQRDERLRRHLADALGTLRRTFTSFVAASAADSDTADSDTADSSTQPPLDAYEQFANVMLGLGIGLAMLKLTDPDAVPDGLLGTALSILARTMGSDPEAVEMLAELGRTHAGEGARSNGESHPNRDSRHNVPLGQNVPPAQRTVAGEP
ncbi:MAG: TetR/AcrR family transcriptional regulator [Solirubrobacteraceae bacterium]